VDEQTSVPAPQVAESVLPVPTEQNQVAPSVLTPEAAVQPAPVADPNVTPVAPVVSTTNAIPAVPAAPTTNAVPAVLTPEAAVQPVPVADPNVTPVAPVVPTTNTIPAVSTSGGKSILIIEDERPLAHALELKLSHSGFTAKAVNSGEAALTALTEAQYDIILLDLILPGMDGFELLQKIRETNQTVKIVVLSNLGQSEDKARTEPFKITEYYIKSNVPLASVVQSLQTLS
jgi:CheY-like chemotaxis protein